MEKQISTNEISLLEGKITALKENVSVLNTEITALRSIIIEQLLVIKKKLRKKHPQSVHHSPN